jgi:hypothetical protein
MTIKEFYLKNYPTDDMGEDINSEATFEGLFHVLERYGDVYDYIGVGDSLVRERLFDELAYIIGISYAQVHEQWSMAF